MLKFVFDPDLSHMSGAMLASLIIIGFLIVFFIIMGIVFSKMKKRGDAVPTKGLKYLMVVLVDTLNKFSDTNLGKENRKIFAPYFLATSVYIGFANVASIFGITPPFSNLAIALTLSIFAFVIFQFTGLKYQGLKERVVGFMGPVKGVSFLVFPISIIGEFTTPFSMGMRMFGNIFSGCVIAGMVFAVTEGLSVVIGTFVSGIAFIIIHAIFDIFFGLLQMYVYLMLTTMFVKQNM